MYDKIKNNIFKQRLEDERHYYDIIMSNDYSPEQQEFARQLLKEVAKQYAKLDKVLELLKDYMY